MIILDGKHISEFGFDMEPGYEDPITPYFEHKTISIPGRPGLWDFGVQIKDRPFSFPLKIEDRFHDNMQSAYNKLIAFLCDEYGKPREIKIVREYETDKFIKAKLAEQLVPERLTDESNLHLPFVAYDPYKYSNVFADEVTWGSEIITFEADYLLGHTNDFAGGSKKITGPQTLNISVNGLVVQPNIIIEGTASNLTLSANGHSFTLPNFSNTKWKIDFEKYLVSRNGQETMIEIRDFILKQGNNEINITGSNINIDLAVKFRDKYN